MNTLYTHPASVGTASFFTILSASNRRSTPGGRAGVGGSGGGGGSDPQSIRIPCRIVFFFGVGRELVLSLPVCTNRPRARGLLAHWLMGGGSGIHVYRGVTQDVRGQMH